MCILFLGTHHHPGTSGPVPGAPAWRWRPSKGGWHPQVEGYGGSLRPGLNWLLHEWDCRPECKGSPQYHQGLKGGILGRMRGCCWHRQGGTHEILGCWCDWGYPGNGASLGRSCGLVRMGGQGWDSLGCPGVVAKWGLVVLHGEGCWGGTCCMPQEKGHAGLGWSWGMMMALLSGEAHRECSHQPGRHQDQLQAWWEWALAGWSRALSAWAALRSPECHIHHWVLSLLSALGG